MKRKTRIIALLLALSLLTAALPAHAAELVAENLELRTCPGLSVGGQLRTAGGEEGVTFRITTEPVKGELTLEEDGRFVYTPAEGKRGRDYFGYKAVDAQGNESREATVVIKLEKRKTSFRYEDTERLACDYAAHVLAAKGLFTGQQLAGHYLFEPARTVSRGEFLSLCMSAAGVDTLQGLTSTGYADDALLEAWLKPYVSTALLNGYTDGLPTAGGCFDRTAAVTVGEAAMMIEKIFRITPVSAAETAAEEAAVADLAACGLWESVPTDTQATLTRAEAAVLLLRAMEESGRR